MNRDRFVNLSALIVALVSLFLQVFEIIGDASPADNSILQVVLAWSYIVSVVTLRVFTVAILLYLLLKMLATLSPKLQSTRLAVISRGGSQVILFAVVVMVVVGVFVAVVEAWTEPKPSATLALSVDGTHCLEYCAAPLDVSGSKDLNLKLKIRAAVRAQVPRSYARPDTTTSLRITKVYLKYHNPSKHPDPRDYKSTVDPHFDFPLSTIRDSIGTWDIDATTEDPVTITHNFQGTCSIANDPAHPDSTHTPFQFMRTMERLRVVGDMNLLLFVEFSLQLEDLTKIDTTLWTKVGCITTNIDWNRLEQLYNDSRK